MPRSARIDIEGLLQHVIVRGIEKRDIFYDDKDRRAFLDRLSPMLLKTKTQCLAWALMSNHFHLLLRPTQGKLSQLMRRLLTGYAVSFNLRHHRSGHLFQNRYKSIVCDEDAYLLELVRYIHLNPLRAGLAPSMDKLDSYKWSGHAVIIGRKKFPGQNVDEVLQLFANNSADAVTRYRQFVADGIALGKRDELVGGGLKRHLKLSASRDFEAYDERVLGSGQFVEQLWRETQDLTPVEATLPLDELADQVAAAFDLETEALRHGSKRKELANARAVLCYIATRKLGYSGVKLSKTLGLSPSGIVLAAKRGEVLYNKMPILHVIG
ncbi:transposase [Geomonas anaerohicana]|uniref:Transposase n=1 Tax=Geomonas anaerohicana TaxID=2798583 RepID=A0ABS0YGN0_9BACT|nr:transposase [Geomonas anaerohicana]MBJ6751479.1 transposase [Geomonas anaerohicana]